jgi:hypothetical protein
MSSEKKQEILSHSDTAREHLKKIWLQTYHDQEVESAMEELLFLAEQATRFFWSATERHPDIAEKLAKKCVSIPVSVSPIELKHDTRPKKKKQLPYSVEHALKLPIGQDLPIRIKGSAGSRGPNNDWLNHYIRDIIIAKHLGVRRFQGLDQNMAPKFENLEVDRDLANLLPLSEASIEEWANYITDSLDKGNGLSYVENPQEAISTIAQSKEAEKLMKKQRAKYNSEVSELKHNRNASDNSPVTGSEGEEELKRLSRIAESSVSDLDMKECSAVTKYRQKQGDWIIKALKQVVKARLITFCEK